MAGKGTGTWGALYPGVFHFIFLISKVNVNWRARCWSPQALKTHQLRVCKHLGKQTASQGFQIKSQGRSQPRSSWQSSKGGSDHTFRWQLTWSPLKNSEEQEGPERVGEGERSCFLWQSQELRKKLSDIALKGTSVRVSKSAVSASGVWSKSLFFSHVAIETVTAEVALGMGFSLPEDKASQVCLSDAHYTEDTAELSQQCKASLFPKGPYAPAPWEHYVSPPSLSSPALSATGALCFTDVFPSPPRDIPRLELLVWTTLDQTPRFSAIKVCHSI